MDLDKLKQEWQHNDAFQKIVEESVIQKMLANQNKGALNRIKKNEREALKVIPICTVLFVVTSSRLLVEGGFGMFWVLSFIPIGALLWYWSKYLCGFLDKIDMGTMSVPEVTKYILQYKKYVVYHTIGASIFLPVYLGVWFYCFYSSAREPLSGDNMGIALTLYVLAALVLFFVIIWFRFFRHIRNLQNNLKELNDFMKGEE